MVLVVCKGTSHIYQLFFSFLFFFHVYLSVPLSSILHTRTHTRTQTPHKAAIILTSGGGDSCADLTQKMHLRNTEEEAR